MSGRRKTTERVADPSSSTFNEFLHGDQHGYDHRIHDVQKHIGRRLKRYFKFGAMLQAISELTGIERDELVKGGKSLYQDQSSDHGSKYHAAHVIRVGAVSEKLKTEHPELHTTLINYIGHTQVVPMEANQWSGVGGKIDRFQSENLELLAKINFKVRQNEESKGALKELVGRMDVLISSFGNIPFVGMDYAKTVEEWMGLPEELHAYAFKTYYETISDAKHRAQN